MRSATTDLTRGPVFSGLIKLALPIFGSGFASLAYAMASIFWLGWMGGDKNPELGSQAQSAVGTACFYTWLGFCLVTMMRIGAKVGVAQTMGAREPERAARIGTAAMQLGAVFSLLFSLIIMIFATPLIGFFKLDPDTAALAVMRDSGFLAMTSGKLTVKGLAAGYYKLTLEGADAGKYSADELAAGIGVPGNTFAPAQRLHDLIQRKEESYYTAWRQVRLPLADLAGSQQIVDGLMAADEGYQAVIHGLATPLAKCTFTLSAAPEGPNLAQGKRYACSDENKYNWGIGGLTDGSWAATPQHCFATGDAADLPKHVTIDLEKAARVGTVVFGVPPFGSTKTVKVSVSADGQQFTEVGSHEFTPRKEAAATVAFPAIEARYVRLTYVDRHEEDIQFPRVFAFTTEVEVYATAK
jgi:hypothetical protein